jgi:hypothetical protein
MTITEENRESVFVWIGGAHLLVTVLALLLSFGGGMGRFDTGTAASFPERAAAVTFEVVQWPLIPLCMALPFDLPGPIGWLPFLLNSALWGFCLYWISVRLIWRRRRV